MENTSIFEDLEISVEGIMEEAHIADFKYRVFEGAKELEAIMDEDTSVSSLEKVAKDNYTKKPEFKKSVEDLLGQFIT